MTRQELKQRFIAMPDHEKMIFLAEMSFDLTIGARETYITGTDLVSDPARLRLFNEAQHQLTGHLHHLLRQDADRYPDGVFAEILFECLKDLRCLKRLDVIADHAVGA